MRLAPVVVLVAACARPACPPTKLGAPAGPFLWEVTGDAGGTLYLHGTLHVASADDIPPSARAALARSTRFVDELGALPPDEVRARARLPRGQSLDQLLGPDDWYDLRDALAGVIPDDELKRARPWYAMSLLTAAMAPGPARSMDDTLEADARGRGAEIMHLETGAEQLGALAESVSVDDLKQAIAERREMRCGVADLLAAYRAGDGERLRGELGGDAARKLLDERNARWLPKLEGWLRGGGVTFVAVGVNHLVGPGSVPALLAERGWRVARMP